MIKNIQSLKSKVRNYSQKTGVSHQQIIQNYIFERFLERVSYSNYKYNFIIKGGCLLSSVMGIDMRTTMDIDTNISGVTFTKETLEGIVNTIIDIDIDDGITFHIRTIEEIKETKDYNGFRFKMISNIDNMVVPFDIDISTGDIITPNSIQYRYKKVFEDGYIDIIAYNYETIIAEKLQAILELKLRNSRMKDYYDLYYFAVFRWNELDLQDLKRAVQVTFSNRNSLSDLNNAYQLIKIFKEDDTLNQLWKGYQETHNYAKQILFVDVIESLEKIVLTINQEIKEFQKI